MPVDKRTPLVQTLAPNTQFTAEVRYVTAADLATPWLRLDVIRFTADTENPNTYWLGYSADGFRATNHVVYGLPVEFVNAQGERVLQLRTADPTTIELRNVQDLQPYSSQVA